MWAKFKENTKERNTGTTEQLLITGNENALNFADMARAIGIQRGSSATVQEL